MAHSLMHNLPACFVWWWCYRNYQVIDAEEGTLENVVDLGVSQVWSSST
jgi:hypothetical protein